MKKSFKVLLWILAVLVIVVFGGSIAMKSIEARLSELSTQAIPDITPNNLADGLYQGSYAVFPVKVVVEVAVAQGKIVTIKLLEHRQGQGKAAEALIPQVVGSQSIQLDAVSGATYSSKVILLAIADALGTL
ncbi:MAG: FMN-binding protein [Spirochaetae bacterium HGW-Spirochaetae-8]|nr:MAG: FMN-binding protein [Spirochaetae bacterium HGW-Spirochaetae-8]